MTTESVTYVSNSNYSPSVYSKNSATSFSEKENVKKFALLKAPDLASGTNSEVFDEDTIFRVVKQKSTSDHPKLTQAKKTFASGAVVQIEEKSAICEIYSESTSKKISIPISLFPSRVFMGYTFQIKLDSSGGFKKPVITQETREAPKEIQSEIDDLLKLID